jgi:hypothetical protein
MKTLDALVTGVRGAVEKMFAELGEVRPLFFLETQEGELIVIPASWGNRAEKQVIVLAVQEICRIKKVRRAVIVTEGWMVARPAGHPTEDLTPSEEPDRQEVLWIVAQTNVEGERGAGWLRHIVRDAGGKPSLAEAREMDTSTTTSIFDGIVGGRVLQ